MSLVPSLSTETEHEDKKLYIVIYAVETVHTGYLYFLGLVIDTSNRTVLDFHIGIVELEAISTSLVN